MDGEARGAAGAPAAAAQPGAARVLAVCDEVVDQLYGPAIRERHGEYDFVLSCGDLPAYYLDFVASMLDIPVYGIHGNHDGDPHDPSSDRERATGGVVQLHGRVVRDHGLLIGGFDGCLRYNGGAYQFSETEMRLHIARMIPALLLNKLLYGRYLDVLITHAPPFGIHDLPDRAHQGFKVFRWFLQTFTPRYQLHGHIHQYNRQAVTRTRFHETEVINVFPYRALTIPAGAPRPPARPAPPGTA